MADRRKGAVRTCAICGGVAVRETRRRSIVFKSEAVEIDQPAWWCNDCDDAMLDSRDAAVADRAFATLRARAEGVMTPAEIERVRKRLKLSQRRAGALLGGGARAFQRYESGAVVVSKPMSNLLTILDRRPTLIAQLTASEPRRSTGAEG